MAHELQNQVFHNVYINQSFAVVVGLVGYLVRSPTANGRRRRRFLRLAVGQRRPGQLKCVRLLQNCRRKQGPLGHRTQLFQH